MNPLLTDTTGLSILKDPFTKDGVNRVLTHCYRNYKGEWVYSGSVHFQNGATKGEQGFDAQSFADLLKQLEDFINTLKS